MRGTPTVIALALLAQLSSAAKFTHGGLTKPAFQNPSSIRLPAPASRSDAATPRKRRAERRAERDGRAASGSGSQTFGEDHYALMRLRGGGLVPSGVSLQSIREYRLPRTRLTVEDALRLLVKIRLYAAGAELVTALPLRWLEGALDARRASA
jgi:hypothetical protein